MPHASSRARWRLAFAAIAALALLPLVARALWWQRSEEDRTLCQTNLRRLSTALLLYAQDHDSCLPPPEHRLEDGSWRTWLSLLDAYSGRQDLGECPSNPAPGATEARLGYPFPYGYAINHRFFGVFAPGPFPLDNLEIPLQTALLVESGMRRESSPFGPPFAPQVMSVYTDTGQDPLAFPSPHRRRMNVVAADGHVVGLRLAHYSLAGHDPQYGRLGGTIYNWNGGHPNNDTAAPPHE